MTLRSLGLAAAALALAGGGAARAAPVLMISIDGLRPLDVLDAKARGVQAPNLERLVREGTAAQGVHNALPSVTYPNHTTLITGVWPDRHGIVDNTVFDPLNKDMGGWYWYSSDIKVPTLWDAAHARGLRVASLGWPVTVGQKSIDLNIPEYWRAHDANDAKLNRALATPGLPEQLERDGHVAFPDTSDTTPDADAIKAKAAEAIYALDRPDFFTLHLSSLDNVQHEDGPATPQAHAALARIDAEVGELVAAARRVEPSLVVVVVSDHGFAAVDKDINIGAAFVDAGLITLDAKGEPVAWEAAPWISGGSAAVVLSRPDDPVLQAKVKTLLDRLAADPNSGVAQVIGRREIAARGGAPQASFFVDCRIGYEFGPNLTGPLVTTPPIEKGDHGYFPDHPEMRATLIMQGPSIPAGRRLGEIDMRDIAPTVAELLAVNLPTADGKPLLHAGASVAGGKGR